MSVFGDYLNERLLGNIVVVKFVNDMKIFEVFYFVFVWICLESDEIKWVEIGSWYFFKIVCLSDGWIIWYVWVRVI